MLGAVAVAVNCFNTADVVAHCVAMAGSVVAIVDEERMVALEGWKGKLKESGCPTLLVVRASGTVASGFNCLRTELEGFEASDLGVVAIEPEDNATIFFTSGTSGLPKGVLSTQRQFLSNLLNSLVAGTRAILRGGGDMPVPNPDDPQRTYLLVSRRQSSGRSWQTDTGLIFRASQPVPLFHVMGCQGALMVTTASAGKVCAPYPLLATRAPHSAS